MEQQCHQYSEEESKIRNKSVVIPRSSILLKNKKNIKKHKDDKEKERVVKNYSVSPSRIMFNSKLKLARGSIENDEGKDQIKYKSLKNYNKGRINFKSSKLLNGDNSMNSLGESYANKAPMKFIKHKKKNSNKDLDINPKKVENARKSLPSGHKPTINIQKVKIIESNFNQEFKMKGRKLNLRFKDFSKSNTKKILPRKEIRSEAKVNKTLMYKVNGNCEYSNDISVKEVNNTNYSTNSSILRPQK